MNISRKNGIRFFGSLVLSGTTLNSVGVSTALAMEPAPPAGSLTQKYPNSTCSEIKNSDLYKYIEKTIPQDELERLKIEFEKDNLAAKSDDELLKIFSAKSLRFLVITNKLGSNFNSEKSGKINLAIERAWKLRLHKISEHYRKIFGNYENISQENLCLKFLDLNSADSRIIYASDVNQISTGISGKTTVVVMGQGAGPSKIKKIEEWQAKGHDIRIIYEEELKQILNYGKE